MKYQIAIFMYIIVSVSSQDLKCYECDPRSAGKCQSPDINNIPTTICTNAPPSSGPKMKMTEEILAMSQNSAEPPFCYSLYFDAGLPEHTGFYRGCSKNAKGVDHFCTNLTDRLADNKTIAGKMAGCNNCSQDNCNVGNFEGIVPVPVPDSVANPTPSAVPVIDSDPTTIAAPVKPRPRPKSVGGQTDTDGKKDTEKTKNSPGSAVSQKIGLSVFIFNIILFCFLY